MLDDSELVHPVHERMTFLNDTLEFAADAGNQLIPGKQVTGIHRHLFRTQKVGFNPVFPELGPLNESAIFKFLDYPRTFAAVDPELLPELALEDSLGIRLNKFQCLFNRIFHCDHLSYFLGNQRRDCQDVIAPDDDSAKASSPLVIDKLNSLFHVNIQVLIDSNKAPL